MAQLISETQPLLSPSQKNDSLQNTSPQDKGLHCIGKIEEPRPFINALADGSRIIQCRVCDNMIDITGKENQHVVKCDVCNEATPLKTAPLQKKYVRCPCNCLLICKESAPRIACPRSNCKRILNLQVETPKIISSLPLPPDSVRVECVHCGETFLFNLASNTLARCPHCRKVSSVGSNFARKKSLLFLIFTFLMLTTSVAILITTHIQKKPTMIILYVSAFLLTFLFFLRFIYYCTMKKSSIECLTP
ncbi:unnamed protein product [Gordionus sp. m RMFG-2023]